MRTIGRISIFAFLLSLFSVGNAAADSFVPLPAVGGQSKHLKIRFVEYKGGTNGQMVIEVKNASKRARSFSAEGIFFVPKGDPEKAPQRLGAAGQFMEIATSGKTTKHMTKTKLRPGETKRLHLEVFCIDSHRSSPSTSTKFRIAKKLLPKKLRQEITVGNQRILRTNKGSFRKAKSAIQSHMWKTRDKKWIKLEGERANEKAAPQQRYQRQRMNAPIQQRRIKIKRPSRNVD